MLTVPFFLFNIFNGIDFLDINAFDSIRININKPSPLLYIGGAFAGLAIVGFILELVFIVKAGLTAREGKLFKYPLTINFLK